MTERLEKLKELEISLKDGIDTCKTDQLASLARQYREVLKEIEEIEGTKGNTDGISELLQRRQLNGLPGAIRKNNS